MVAVRHVAKNIQGGRFSGASEKPKEGGGSEASKQSDPKKSREKPLTSVRGASLPTITKKEMKERRRRRGQ